MDVFSFGCCGAKKMMRRFTVSLLVLFLVLATLSEASAQRSQYGTLHQSFSCSSIGPIIPFTVAFTTIPGLVMMIGNAASMRKSRSRAWGVAGAVISGIGLTTEAALLTGIAIQRGPSPCDGTHIGLSLSFMAIHLVTASLSAANIVHGERLLIRRRMNTLAQRKIEWREHRLMRRAEKNKPSTPIGKARPAPTKPREKPVRISCKQIYALYRSTLNDALTSEDKEQSGPLLDKLEREYYYCFISNEGKLYLQQRQTIFQSIQPSLPRDAPLIRLKRKKPPARRAIVPAQRAPIARKAPPRRAPARRIPSRRPPARAAVQKTPTRRTPVARRRAVPRRKPSVRRGIPIDLLNQIAAGKVPPTRRKVPARRKAPARRVPKATKTPPPKTTPTPARNTLLKLEL